MSQAPPTVRGMRLLHTSDWHLGRAFHRVDLLAAQARFLDHLVEVVRRERVDVVLVAGDVYDRALPPVDAVALCDDALRWLAATGVRTVVISGNHDSPRRLGWASGLIDAAGVHVRTEVSAVGEPVLVEDNAGPVAVYPLPYLEPDVVGGDLGDESLRGHQAVLAAAMERVRADLARRPGARSVVVAHAFIAGAAESDSERDISVGGVARVPASVFVGVDYVALGHLHGAQVVADGARYSGSPLAYSFSESGQLKSSWLVELGPRGVTAVERVPCPVPRPLARLSGRLEQLLTSPAYTPYEDHFLSVVLTDPDRPAEPMARLQRRFPHAVCLEFAPAGRGGDGCTYLSRVRGREDLDVVRAFVEHVRTTPLQPGEAALVRAALTAHRLTVVGS